MQNPYRPTSTYGLDLPDWFTDWLGSERKQTRQAFEVLIRQMDKGVTVVVDGKTRDLSDAFARATLPDGVIVMFSGTLQQAYRLREYDLWVCDGSRGTPDLANKFVVGASDGKGSGSTGGANVHFHGIAPAVFNTEEANITVAVDSDLSGTTIAVPSEEHEHEVNVPMATTDEASNVPVYYSLIFLMKKKR